MQCTHTGLSTDGQAAKEVERAGVSAPLGFFDPLGFYKGKNTRQKKKLRECESGGCNVLIYGLVVCLSLMYVCTWGARPLVDCSTPPRMVSFYERTAEVKHGRVAMLAAVRTCACVAASFDRSLQ